ncbi:MAG TPA: sulfate/molybdate ABC transporter ATP-binding protein [Solimonas sp.]|nr:sulfate/molybdate ABC transporter ATP-binding protein [Solimonas sp.]
MDIHVRGIQKNFGGFTALDRVDLDIRSGELIALLGPSGSGKTTLLRVIAGLEFPAQGQVLFGTEDMAARAIRERRVGFVFQHYALFRHMTVLDNIAFGLRVRDRKDRPSETQIRAKALQLLDLVQLSGLEKRYPAQLSGGQRQRVALARALAIEPRVLLLDEPFGALDAKVRKDLRRWLRELHEKTGYTTIFVTHDQEEALELADRVVIMNRGRIEQVGTVDEVYERPASPFVFDFLGGTNILSAEVRGREIHLPGGDHPLPGEASVVQGRADLYVRPGDLRLADGDAPGFPATLRQVQKTGPIVRVSAEAADGTPLSIEFPHLHHDVPRLVPGARLRLRPQQYSLYPASQRPEARSGGEAPVLIGSERERGRLG